MASCPRVLAHARDLTSEQSSALHLEKKLVKLLDYFLRKASIESTEATSPGPMPTRKLEIN